MHRPKAIITVDGKPVHGIFYQRLVRLSVTDKSGSTADTVDFELSDGDPFLDIPATGAKIAVSLGYEETGLVPMGEFIVDEVALDLVPYKMKITGKATDFRKALKSHKERSWDNKTVKELVEQVARENGLQAVVDDNVSSHRYEWIGQLGESDLAFLEGLAERHGALFAIKDGKVIFADRGAGKTASGKEMQPFIIRRTMLQVGAASVRFSDRGRHKKVKALYQDKGKQRRIEVEVESDPDADAEYTLQHPYGSEEEAGRAARSKSNELKSGADTTECTIVGDPAIVAGIPFRYLGVRPGVDEVTWTAETVTHEFSKSGYETRISGTRKPDDAERVKAEQRKKTPGTGSSPESSSGSTPGGGRLPGRV